MKFTTQKLRETFQSWLQRSECQELLKCYTAGCNPAKFESTRKLFRAPESVKSQEEFQKFIWDMWCDTSQWRRVIKNKLGSTWVNYLGSNIKLDGDKLIHYPEFFKGVVGASDIALVEKYFANPGMAKKCILRLFEPYNALGDDYRLKIVTTPEDDKVIGWTILKLKPQR